MLANKTYTYVSTEGEPLIKRIEMENANKKKGKVNMNNKEQILDENAVIKKQEEFEASKKKMKNMLIVLMVGLLAVVAGAVAYKYFR